jgi:sortase A
MRIVIPRLSIDLPIVEAPVMNGFWELSDTSASHGVGSANPGEIGNTVVFAHARTNLFGPLRDIKKDDLIYILTKDRWFRYRVTETKFVTPQETSIISPTSEETLTLYTCSGFLDSKRLIVTAKPLQP